MRAPRRPQFRNGVLKIAQPIPDLPESGIVLIDMSLNPIASDRGAVNILNAQQLNGTNGDPHVSVPAEILEAIRSRNPADLSSFSMHFLIGKRKYRCRSYVMHADTPGAKPAIAVHFETDEQTADLVSQSAIEYNLSDREEEALRGIALGLTTKELADRMSISPNTVKAFVRLIMIKLGVTTRTAIIGRLLEHNEAK